MNIRQLTLQKIDEVIFPPELEKTGGAALVTQYVQYIQAVTTQKGGHTKTRGEVSGGGAKPWRQKGTGRARQGSIRSPQWRGGGVVFGPRQEENGQPRMPKKMRRVALLTLLTEAAREQRVVIGAYAEGDSPKEIRQQVQKETVGTRRVFVVPADGVTALKAARNLKDSTSVNLDHFGAKQLLGKSVVIVDQRAWTDLVKRYSK